MYLYIVQEHKGQAFRALVFSFARGARASGVVAGKHVVRRFQYYNKKEEFSIFWERKKGLIRITYRESSLQIHPSSTKATIMQKYTCSIFQLQRKYKVNVYHAW